MSRENKDQYRRWIQAFNDRDWTAEAAARGSDFAEHAPLDGLLDGAGWAQVLRRLDSGFPDAQITVEDQVAERDLVASRWSMTGTHRGGFMGVAASGRQVFAVGLSLTRFVDGEVAEQWSILDTFGLLQQISTASMEATSMNPAEGTGR